MEVPQQLSLPAPTTAPPVKSKHAKKRSDQQRERDLALIARMYVRGWSLRDIAKRIKVSESMIRYDLKEVRQNWMDAQLYSYNERKAQELARIDALEREAWRAWRRSCKEATRTRTEQITDVMPVSGISGKNVKKASLLKQQRDGNPSFMDKIAWCIDKRCQILGLDAPKKYAPTTPDGTQPYGGRPYEELTDAELIDIIVRSARENGSGTTLEASFSAPESDRLCDVHTADLPGELAPPIAGELPGPLGAPRDQEAAGVDATAARQE